MKAVGSGSSSNLFNWDLSMITEYTPLPNQPSGTMWSVLLVDLGSSVFRVKRRITSATKTKQKKTQCARLSVVSIIFTCQDQIIIGA